MDDGWRATEDGYRVSGFYLHSSMLGVGFYGMLYDFWKIPFNTQAIILRVPVLSGGLVQVFGVKADGHLAFVCGVVCASQDKLHTRGVLCEWYNDMVLMCPHVWISSRTVKL